MADVGDDAEMDSHFLDSMLEVEMTEEDVELDVSKNEDPLEDNRRVLPPIPTFDLQSETLSYKDVYRNPIQVPTVLPTLTLVKSTPPDTVPMTVTVQPRPMLALYSRDVLTGKTTSAVSVKPGTPVPKIPPKSTPPLKPVTKPAIRSMGEAEEAMVAQFLKEVFKPEFVKNVFVKKDPPRDISQVGKEEMDYYKACFKDVSKVQYCRLHCTICDRHLGCGVNVEKKVTVHNMLKVLTCKQCYEFYGDGNFPCDQGDNCEIYCRWCGQGGALVCCSFCPRVFCKKCVRQNYGAPFLRSIQRASEWACFCCAQKPLWPHRAICRALMKHIAQLKSDPKALQKDTTRCCEIPVLSKTRTKPADKSKTTQGQVGTNFGADIKNNIIQPAKTISGREQSLLKNNLRMRMGDQNKIPMSSVLNRNGKTNNPPRSIFSSGTIITGNNIIRNISRTPIKNYSGLPQLIQSPVLHGETLITPPGSRMLMPPKPPPKPPTGNTSFVKISLTNQTPNLDMSKIPTAKIPHDVQGLILRLTFPDNKVQLVRLVTDGNGCKTTKGFPMPEFKNEDMSFVEENLSDSFKLSKMIYDKLMVIRDKVSSRTKFTEESVYASSVEKLHFVYEKSIELLKELDSTLVEDFEAWKSQNVNPVDVIDLSDEDSKYAPDRNKSKRRSTFGEKCKELLPSDDSDIEILENEVSNPRKRGNSENRKAINGDTQRDKFRRRGLGATKLHRSDKVVAVKRKRGPKRKNKRLKVENGNKDGKEKVGANKTRGKTVGVNTESEQVDEAKSEKETEKAGLGGSSSKKSKKEKKVGTSIDSTENEIRKDVKMDSVVEDTKENCLESSPKKGEIPCESGEEKNNEVKTTEKMEEDDQMESARPSSGEDLIKAKENSF